MSLNVTKRPLFEFRGQFLGTKRAIFEFRGSKTREIRPAVGGGHPSEAHTGEPRRRKRHPSESRGSILRRFQPPTLPTLLGRP
uniref:Uncharacterized protein n=1 Tax=Siphoviridae sp. ctjKY6 TaxID=2825631 RepID=A0A8S5UYF0_9CAUD|nr:MAG TPA: hypothetical protein [Siphoviridae sp. ctjKY6]